MKAGGGDGDKEGVVARAHGRAAGPRGTPAACRLEEASAGGKKERISARGAGGGGGAAGVSRSGTPAASTLSVARRRSLGREGGRAARPLKLRQCSSVPGGPNDLVRAGRGAGAERSAQRARNTRGVFEGARGATRPPGDASPAAIHRAAQHTKRGGLTRAHRLRCPARPHGPTGSGKGSHPLPIRSGHGVAPNDRLGGRGAHRTQEATQSDHGPADPSPHRIRLPPDFF